MKVPQFHSGVRLAAALLFSGLALFAQASTGGGLTGTIYDQAGARLDHASVMVKNAATGTETSTQPNDKGVYRFENLPVGNYSIRVSATGLAAVQINDVSVLPTKITTLNLTLSLADSTPVTVVQVSEAPEPTDALLPKPVAAASANASDEQKAILREITAIRDRLALSADQQMKMRIIFQERQSQVAAARQDDSLLPAARREKIKAARQDSEAKFRALLNENQQEEYDEILRERRERALVKQH